MTKEQTKVYLPEDLKALLDADSRTNSEAVEVALWREYGGHKQTALEQRIEEIDNRIDTVNQEMQTRQEEKQELRKERKGLEAKLDEIKNGILTDQEKEEAREILDSGERIFDVHEFVRGIAGSHEISVEEAHKAVRNSLEDEYPPIAFELSGTHEPTNWKEAIDRDD